MSLSKRDKWDSLECFFQGIHISFGYIMSSSLSLRSSSEFNLIGVYSDEYLLSKSSGWYQYLPIFLFYITFISLLTILSLIIVL